MPVAGYSLLVLVIGEEDFL